MVEKKFTIGWVLRNIFLWFIVVVMVFPFLHMLSVSLSGNVDVMKGSVSVLPMINGKIGATLGTYKHVLSNPLIFTAYRNTIVYTVLGTAAALFVLSTGAYALSKPNRLLGGKTINILIMITMFFGGGMVPTFLCIKWLGLYDTIWAVVLPGAFSAYNCIIMRTFFSQFPKEIEESGKLDGLNDIGILWYLVLPTSGAVLATIGLFVAVGQWNAFFGPLLYLNGSEKYPLQLILRQIVLQSVMDNFASGDSAAGANLQYAENSVKYATIIVSILPIIAVYPFLQKYFVKGVMIGSVKG
ncbi:MAG: carbohydrate ABC transporter permease [Oscillospiraceae bacterium]|nr:carbohydrate ABC transporter permease [Oscillospiraceae bacterium]